MQNIDYESIGLRIKNYRSNIKKWSQEELAEKAGMSRTYVSHIELASKSPSLESIVAIANALGVSANDLLVDNLTNTGATFDSDINYLLLDCTEAESKIITRTAKGLKKLLREYQIK